MLLLQYFNELTQQPKNAKKLKGLILELAVRGKLTQQWRAENPNTPSAKGLLDQIKAEKKQLIAAKKIRKEKPLPPIKAEEIPFDVPDSWVWCRLKEVTHSLGQKKPDVNFQYLDVSSIDNQKGKIKDNVKIVLFNDAPSRARKIVKKGTVIYSTVRPYLKNIAVIEKDFSPEAIASTAFAILYPTTGYSSKYLFYFLRSIVFTEYVESKMKGISYPAINDKNLFKGLICLPPLPEQKAIVTIVEELFQEVEDLEQLTQKRLTIKQAYVQSILQQLETGNTGQVWQQLQPNFGTFFDTVESVKALRQTILQLAVQGKLTTDWRSQNPTIVPASELLQQIQAEKAVLLKAKKIKKEKVLPPIKAEEIPFELPDGWIWCRLNEISLKIGDVDHKMPQSIGDGIPYVSPRDFTNSDVINFEGAKKISEEDFVRLAKKIFPERGDIIFPRYGTIGKNIFVKTDRKFIVSYSCAVIKHLKGFTNPQFIFHYSMSPFLRKHFQQYIMKTTQPNVGIKAIKKFLVPLPPLPEQKAIVQKVEQLMGFCDALEAAVLAKAEKRLALMDGGMRGVLAQ